MILRNTYKFVGIFFISVFTFSCVDPFDIATQTFENILVVEATITNELKYQEINLSRTFRLEEEGPFVERNAEVKITDDFQNSYNFQEADSGKYISILKFGAISGRNYKLIILTSDGKKYTSTPTQLSNVVEEFNTSITEEINDDGIEGVAIYANSFDPSGNSKYYRYEYEETYKIIAPYWSPLDAFGVFMAPTNDDPPPLHEVYTLPRTKEERICYNTLYSNKILLIETNLFSEDRVTNFPIRFVAKDDFMITHRYSILVRQYVQSLDAYTFYKTHTKFSDQESLFSQNQPGFIVGNVFSVDDLNERVLGYFEVSSALTQRIFFNFEDFFPNEPKPPHIVGCDIIAPDLDDRSPFGSPEFSPLIKLLMFDGFKFVDFNDPLVNVNNPYLIVRKECGDCTTLGSNIKPDFWVD
jgi:Domain of unknown function (DUF4249)